MISVETDSPTSAQPPVATWPRYLVAFAFFAASLLLLLGLAVRREPQSAVIEGGSMAPTLLGTHWEITCSECQFRWPREESIEFAALGVICPNCAARVANPRQTLIAADRVRIDHLRYQSQPPRRWDIVAIRQGRAWSVKRIVGLPGEDVSLREGNLLIDGQPCEFTLDTWRSQAVIVHDDRYRIPQGTRWNPTTSKDGWAATATGYRLTSYDGRNTLAELRYVHQRYVFGPTARPQASPVLDEDHYNTKPSRELNEVGDLALRLKIQPRKCSELEFALYDGGHWNEARWSQQEQAWQLRQSDVILTSRPTGPELLGAADMAKEQ